MTLILTFASALLLASQPQPDAADGDRAAEEQTLQDAAQAAEEQAAVEEPKVICKRTQVTGSKFLKKMCGTQAQWDALEGKSVENASDMQRKGKGMDPNGR